MKAAVFHAQEDLRIEEVAEPSPGPGQVKLRNAYAGICGSDLHVYFDPANAGLDFEHPHPLTGSTLPQILGHEFSGTVVELGEGVDRVAVGDRVAVWPIYACGECAACRKGVPNACTTIGFHGLTSHGGGMSGFTVVDAAKLHVLPENVDLRLGALVEPMAVAWHAVERSGVQPGQTAFIAGAGPIGIGVYFALKARGIETIIVSEPSEGRRAAIAGVGATELVDPVGQDLAAFVAERTGGDGVDVAFDAAGAAPAFLGALGELAPLGRLVIVALHEKAVDFNPTGLIMRETEIAGTLGYTQADFDAVIAAMADGAYDATGWVETIGLDGVVDAMSDLRSGKRMKVLVSAEG
jgi:(R,R)-butanediol dehydrogenase/meso-butanediol dehydrogenase/diacetyl reductase